MIDQPIDRGEFLFDLDAQLDNPDGKRDGERPKTDAVFFCSEESGGSGAAALGFDVREVGGGVVVVIGEGDAGSELHAC